MKKIQTNILPTEALHGLIHGYARQAKQSDASTKTLIYVDVTDRSAKDALYAILRRDVPERVVGTAYDCVVNFRGHTAPAHLPIILSGSLLHVDATRLSKYLDEIFNALGHTVQKNDTQITIYGEPEIEKLLDLMRESQFENFSAACTPELALGDSELQSNITVDNFVSMAIDPEFEKRIQAMPADTYTFGPEFIFMHYDDLHKVIQMLRRNKKNCTLHPDLYRYYFMNVICKY